MLDRLASGVHPKVVSERLGHSSIAITLDTYSHVTGTLQAEAAEQIAALVFAAPSDVSDPGSDGSQDATVVAPLGHPEHADMR